MNSNWVYVAYYIYAIFVVCLFSYVVFWKDFNGWWFLMALILLNISPTITNKKE